MRSYFIRFNRVKGHGICPRASKSISSYIPIIYLKYIELSIIPVGNGEFAIRSGVKFWVTNGRVVIFSTGLEVLHDNFCVKSLIPWVNVKDIAYRGRELCCTLENINDDMSHRIELKEAVVKVCVENSHTIGEYCIPKARNFLYYINGPKRGQLVNPRK